MPLLRLSGWSNSIYSLRLFTSFSTSQFYILLTFHVNNFDFDTTATLMKLAGASALILQLRRDPSGPSRCHPLVCAEAGN